MPRPLGHRSFDTSSSRAFSIAPAATTNALAWTEKRFPDSVAARTEVTRLPARSVSMPVTLPLR